MMTLPSIFPVFQILINFVSLNEQWPALPKIKRHNPRVICSHPTVSLTMSEFQSLMS